MTEKEIKLLIDLHKDTNRQGPGSESVTKLALSIAGLDKTKINKIADIGCGTGGQTITIAQNTNSHIVAVDLFPEFLDQLDKRVEMLGLQDRITTSENSMEDLPFSDDEFDMIWSEGAIYLMGYEKGIRDWKRFLKPGGILAVSDISWKTDLRPKELEEYWLEICPEIDTISNKIALLEKNGYSPLGHFILPEDCWIIHYYKPLEERIPGFLARHESSDLAKQLVEEEFKEIEMYKANKDYYSYGFYLARKL